MAKGKRTGASYKAYYGSYNQQAQKLKRLERNLNRQPDNQQIVDAIARVKKTPNLTKQKSGGKGGWVDGRKLPFSLLGRGVEKKKKGSDEVSHTTFSQFDAVMGMSPKRKREFAQEWRKTRYAHLQFSQSNRNEKNPSGYAG